MEVTIINGVLVLDISFEGRRKKIWNAIIEP